MPSGQRQMLADFFDDCARRGDMSGFSEKELPKVEALERLWAIAEGECVFEPGCGSGRLTERLARAVGRRGQVIACDLAPEMARRARARVPLPNVDIRAAAILDLELPDAHFDAIICFCAFPHLEELARTMERFRRVLKPRGRFWISHTTGREELNAFHGNAGPAVRLHLLPDETEGRQLLSEAGFAVRQYHDSADGYWVLATPARRIEAGSGQDRQEKTAGSP